jgi:hypothetical protein
MIVLYGVFAVVYPLYQYYVGYDPLSEAQSGPKSVNLKHPLVLKGMFKFKAISQFAERYVSVERCALNMKDIISKNFNKLNK